jgi:PIN domain nuclease of toxin-antitoxin system
LNLLLDTHVLLWYVLGDRRRVGRDLQTRIEDEGATVSVVSVWEAAIESALGKLDAPDDLPFRVEQLGFGSLAIAADHAWQVRRLPQHHGDPFDRLLIAQAQVERLSIVTADPLFDAYDVTVVWDNG